MLNSYIGSIMNMTADIYVQKNIQSEKSGSISREWIYEKTIPCKIEPGKSSSSSNNADNKRFDFAKGNEYDEKFHLKLKSPIAISKRSRVSGIRSNDGKQVYVEIDRYDTPDTIFDVVASHAILDPFGKVSYYEITIQRVHVQNDNTQSR